MGTAVDQRLERAISLEQNGAYAEATALLQAIIADDSSCGDAYYHLGRIYAFTGHFDESLESLQTATRLLPENTRVRNDLALTYAMLGMYDEARAEFEAVLQLEPGNEVATKNLALLG